MTHPHENIKEKDRTIYVENIKEYWLEWIKNSHSKNVVKLGKIMLDHIGRGYKIKIEELAVMMGMSYDATVFELHSVSNWMPIQYAFGYAWVISSEHERKEAIEHQEYIKFIADSQLFNLKIAHLPKLSVFEPANK